MSRETFSRTTPIGTSADELFAWHEAPGAFERLTPPWERVRVLRHEGGITNGARVSLLVGRWPFSLTWDLEHRDYDRGRTFTDVQVRGPFRHWKHVHVMIPKGPTACDLQDTIEYELPCGRLGALLGGRFVRKKLERLFAYRHAVTRRAFEG